MPSDLKSRLVSFRLTAKEYDYFRELCFAQGLPSVSEMARTALQTVIHNPTQLPLRSLEGRVAELESRVHILASEIRQLLSRQS